MESGEWDEEVKRSRGRGVRGREGGRERGRERERELRSMRK